jgi:hypothetical protein
VTALTTFANRQPSTVPLVASTVFC